MDFNIKIVKMEVAITKMSANGQVVIPYDIRMKCNVAPATKFIVFNKGGDILLKQIKEEDLEGDLDLIREIGEGEEDVNNGRFVEVDSSMNVEDIYSLLMEK